MTFGTPTPVTFDPLTKMTPDPGPRTPENGRKWRICILPTETQGFRLLRPPRNDENDLKEWRKVSLRPRHGLERSKGLFFSELRDVLLSVVTWKKRWPLVWQDSRENHRPQKPGNGKKKLEIEMENGPKLERKEKKKNGNERKPPHPRPQTPDPRPQTPNPRRQTPDRRPQTPNPRRQIPDPGPRTPDPGPRTPDPRPQTPDCRPQTTDPRPQTPERDKEERKEKKKKRKGKKGNKEKQKEKRKAKKGNEGKQKEKRKKMKKKPDARPPNPQTSRSPDPQTPAESPRPQSQTPDPRPQTPRPRPQTRDPRPQTLDPDCCFSRSKKNAQRCFSKFFPRSTGMSTQTPTFTQSIPESNSVDAELQNAEGRYQKVKSRYQKKDISIPKKRSRYRKGDLRDLDTKKKTSRYQKKMHPKKSTQNNNYLNKFFLTISVEFLTYVTGKKAKCSRKLFEKVRVNAAVFWYFGILGGFWGPMLESQEQGA